MTDETCTKSMQNEHIKQLSKMSTQINGLETGLNVVVNDFKLFEKSTIDSMQINTRWSIGIIVTLIIGFVGVGSSLYIHTENKFNYLYKKNIMIFESGTFSQIDSVKNKIVAKE